MLNGWEFDDFAHIGLPTGAANAYNSAFEHKGGTKFLPILYIGEQQVKDGTNYMMICHTESILPNSLERIVNIVINVDSTGKGKLVSTDIIA